MAKHDEPKVKKHVVLYERDVERINAIFGGRDEIGFSAAVRNMVRLALNQIEAKAAQRAKAVPVDEATVAKMVEGEGQGHE